MKRIIAFLLCLVMVISVCPVSTFAVATEPNVTLTVNKTEVNVGDTITVTLGVTEMTASSVAFGFDFDTELVSVARINTRNCYLTYEAYDPDFDEYYDVNVSPSEMSTLEEANEDGHIGIVFASGREYDYKTNAKMVVITLTALASGTVEFKMFEDSAGPDGYKDEWTHETTVIIGGSSEPECDHSSTKLVPNADGKTHNVVCTNEACNGYVVRTENCSGTDDGDHTTAVMCACGNTVTAATEHTYTQKLRGTKKSAGDCVTKAVYAVKCDYCAHESDTLTVEGEYGDHTYGDLIPAQEAVHTETELKGAVAAHYLCQCGKYFTEGKVETTLAALTGDTPEHTVDPSKTTTETTKEPTCTEEGTKSVSTFCSCGYAFPVDTQTIPAVGTAHDWNTPTYSWSADGTTCTATRTCKHDAAHKEEETVEATPSVTTVGTCQIEEVVTYTANFDAEWAQDGQTNEVTGDTDPNKHVGTPTVSYRCNDGYTHTEVSTYACGHSVDGATTDCADGDDADELCDACGNNLHVHTHDLYDYINYESHEIFCDCGETLGVVAHELGEDGSCVCGAIKLRVDFEFANFEGNDDPIEGLEPRYFWVMPDQDLVLDVYPTNGYGYVNYCIADWDDESDDAPYEAGIIDELKVSTDWYDAEWLYISVRGVSCQTIDLNGGSVVNPDDWGEDYDPEKNVIFNYGNEKSSWKLSWYTEESEEIVREGYKLSGFMRDGKFHDVDEWIYGKAGDETLTLVWECNHDADIHDYSYTYEDSSTHTVNCKCGETIDTVAHEHGEDGSCVCGAFLVTMDYNGGADKLNPGEPSDSWYTMEHTLQWNDEFCKDVYTKDGYVFAGFASDAAGENLLPYGTVFQSSTTFYVAWECNHDEAVHEYTYTDNRNGTHTVKCACGEILETTEPHDYTTGTSAHTCACEAVEKFTLSFDLNGGTLADEYGEFEAYIQDGKFILPDIEYGALIQYNRFYQEGWLVKEGYHITGFEDEDGNFHSLESDDVFTMTGATTLTVIWEVNEYTLTVNVRATGELVDLTVPYGANLLEVLAAAAEDGKIPALGEKIRVNNADQNGENLPYQYSYYVDDDEEPGWIAVDENFTMPAEDFAIDQDHGQNGWVFSDFGDGRVGAEYCVFEDGYLGSGWHYIDENYDDVEGGAWYYFAEGTGAWAGGLFFRVEGLTRVPYPTEPINGWTYAADADALAYDPSFIDKDEAWFLFDEEGKFQYDTNGDIGWYEINDANELRYMNHGMLEWHPGLIKNGDDYYYFIGDVVNGGNIAAEGDTWITKNNGNEDFAIGDIYNFAEGKLSGADGIVDGKYYENSRLMAGNGLTKIQVEGVTKFIYVRSNGYIVVNAEYYVPANDKGVVPGTYAFDENGYLINPELTGKDGIYFENGAWYYYENGVIVYNKGLIEVTETWYDGEGTVETTAVIYVRSNGQLAMGYYYVTNVANYNGSAAIASGTKLLFDNYGALAAAMNGIVDGYYYQNNQIVYGAGVVEIEEGKYIYVKSDGTVVMNRNYWITNVGDTGVVAKLYTFDENGYFTPEFVADQKDGIVDGYYYENGAIAYGKGLIEYNGGLIYVRSNGQVATGKYWITTTNGLKESGYYTFGEDGMMIN